MNEFALNWQGITIMVVSLTIVTGLAVFCLVLLSKNKE